MIKVYYIPPKGAPTQKELLARANSAMVCCFMNLATCVAATTPVATKTLDDVERELTAAGEKIFSAGSLIGYWACAIVCLYEIISRVHSGDTKAIYGILTRYALLYGAMFIIRIVLDAVRGIFI